MPTISGPMSGAAPYYLELTVEMASWQLRITREQSAGAGSNQNGASYSVTIDGQTYSGSFNFSFPASGSVNFLVASRTRSTFGTVSVSARVDTITSAVGDGNISGTVTIASGPRVRVAGTWRNTVAYVRVGGAWRQAVPYVRSGGTWRQVG